MPNVFGRYHCEYAVPPRAVLLTAHKKRARQWPPPRSPASLVTLRTFPKCLSLWRFLLVLSLFPWAPFPVVFVAAVFVPLVAHYAQLAVPLAPDVALAVQLDVLQGDLQDALSVPYELLAVRSAAHLADDHW